MQALHIPPKDYSLLVVFNIS